MDNHLPELKKIVEKTSNTFTNKEELEKHSIKGETPSLIIYPNSYQNICDIVGLCNSYKLTVAPTGGRTKLYYGYKPHKIDVAINLSNIQGIVEHYEEDFVITVKAATPIAELQSELAKKEQFIPLDPPHLNEGATIGGTIATNYYGPLCGKYGSFRQLLLGTKFVRADGKLISTGSRVVKNVAGYDMQKLLIGSLGTLGIIVETTLRLYPLPPYSKTLVLTFPNLENLKHYLDTLRKTHISTTSVVILDPRFSKDLKIINDKKRIYTILVKISNTRQAVEQQVDIASLISKHHILKETITDKEEITLWEKLTNQQFKSKKSKIIAKINVPIGRTLKILEYIEHIFTDLDIYVTAYAIPYTGTMIISLNGEGKNVLMACKLLRSQASSLEGNLTILRNLIEKEDKNDIDIFNFTSSSLELMRRIKQKFDPNGILNPNRLLHIL